MMSEAFDEKAPVDEKVTFLKNVQEMLNEEKWTRATLSNYSANQFKELDQILKEARDARIIRDGQDLRLDMELKGLCDEHLTHSKNSIIALYLSGMISISHDVIEDSNMNNLVGIFLDNHKWNIVNYLCERILDYGESKFALRTLVECYKNESKEDAIYGIWERLVKVDYEEADIAKSLAEHYEKQGDIENAIDYYKKALHRYINKALITNVREIWEKLLGYCSNDIDFFLHVEKRIAKNISEDKAVLLLQDVYQVCRKKDDIETAINILKIILQYDERDVQARKELVECFRQKYASHSQLEEYIRISNISQNWRPVHEAVADFEKHIAFDKGNFVFHRTWGAGRIDSVQGDEIVIDFAKKRSQSMSLRMAVNSLQTLAKKHIWVLKATRKKEALHDKIKENHAWALKTVIKSFGNSCDIKKIKAELVPSILSAGEWTTWVTKARDILKSDPNFGVSPDNIDLFTVRDRPISIEEKLYNEFKAERNFFNRAQTLRLYLTQADVELDSEYFKEMFGYFTSYLPSASSIKQVNENIVASCLLIKELAGKFPTLANGLSLNFASLFEKIEDIPELFQNLKDSKLREEFLKQVKLLPDWEDVYIQLFPYILSNSIIEDLLAGSYENKLVALVSSSFENIRESSAVRETAVWFFKNAPDTPWFKKAGLSYEKQLITLIHILDISYRDIENHRDTPDNRKVNKQVYSLLFTDKRLIDFIDQGDRDTIMRIFTFIQDVKDLDPADKIELKKQILLKHPDFKFLGDEEKTVITRGLMVTAVKYEEKNRQLAHIMEVEVPANSKEIGFALSLGDLRENAEYKAAKEKQEILNSTVAKLKDEIDRAQIFDPAAVNTNRVSFGTKVVLRSTKKNGREEYSILGPWESDPENNVISYLSPFGSAMLNKVAGEGFDFSANNETVHYVVEEISAVPI
ncbi:MAG: transcription elongation factor GreA [Treponema sp.]|jgi:transcription elongation factor GreA|nr:transcription elongation factor GreA [Treponema sp.]